MRKIGGLLLIFVFSFMLASGVYAICEDNQTILKISSSTNAHGELWNQNNYNTAICYTDVFLGQTGNGNHTCDGSNTIIALSSATNAHAETNDAGNYNFDVCYGNLECVNSDVDCSGTMHPFTLLSLSSETNAHISAGNDYPIKICCKVEAQPSVLTGAKWLNMKNAEITTANTNDIVKMMVFSTSLHGEINFTVYKERAFWSDKKITSTSGLNYATFKANSAGTYYFRAFSSTNPSNYIESGNIVVSNPEINSRPKAGIISPGEGAIYFAGDVISFAQNSNDEDDEFRYQWDFNDGNITTGRNIDSNYNTTHKYTASGQKNVLLTVTDDRGLKSQARISILIAGEGNNVFAKIDNPKWEDYIFGNSVNFKSNSSYAVSVSGTSITCIAGYCPSSATGSPKTSEFGNMEFNWSFDDTSKKTGLGNAGADITKLFMTGGWHNAILTARLNSASAKTEVNFTIYFEYPYCDLHNQEWVEDGVRKDSINDCYRENAIDGRTKCCSTGECIQDGSSWKCVSADLSCKNYNSESECEDNANSASAVADIESMMNNNRFCDGIVEERADGTCNYVGYCECSWNGTNCLSGYSNITTSCGDVPVAPDVPKCGYLFDSGDCSGSTRVVTWGLNSESNADCISAGTRALPCLTSANVSAISILGIVIAVLLVIAYYIYTRRK